MRMAAAGRRAAAAARAPTASQTGTSTSRLHPTQRNPGSTQWRLQTEARPPHRAAWRWRSALRPWPCWPPTGDKGCSDWDEMRRKRRKREGWRSGAEGRSGDDCQRDFEKTNLQDLGLLTPFRGWVGATLLTISITSHLILCMFYKDVSVQKHISLFPLLLPHLSPVDIFFLHRPLLSHTGAADSIANITAEPCDSFNVHSHRGAFCNDHCVEGREEENQTKT